MKLIELKSGSMKAIEYYISVSDSEILNMNGWWLYLDIGDLAFDFINVRDEDRRISDKSSFWKIFPNEEHKEIFHFTTKDEIRNKYPEYLI